MRPLTMMQAQFKADSQSGEILHFTGCKGGYFSALDDYGLTIAGAEASARCVKAGTKVRVCQKNLFDIDNYELIDLNEAPAFIPRFIDGILYGGGKHGYYVGRSIRIYAKVGDVITITADVVGKNLIWNIRSGDSPDGAYIYEKISDWATPPGSRLVITHEVTKPYTGLAWYAEDGSSWSAGLKNLQFEISPTASDYEPYNAASEITLPCDLLEGDRFWPLTGKVIRHNGVLEQYDPQPIHAPSGTVNVVQTSTELDGTLSATMLVRR